MNERLSIRTDGASNPFNRRAQSETRGDFLRRQFRDEATLAQVIFDITIGIVLPILCLVFDPLVFRNGLYGAPLAGQIQLFAYAFIAIQIIALAVWLGVGSRAGEWCGVLAGIMLAGALFSVGIGIFLLPLSLFGLIVLVGALGFTPFVTAVIYLRNARRALKAAKAQMVSGGLVLTLLLGATLALGAPAFAHWRVNKLIERSVAEVLGGDDAKAEAAARRLRQVSWFDSAELDQVVWAYGRTTDPREKERLALAYYKITGDDIEYRLSMLYD
jgi:hypothetical protein